VFISIAILLVHLSWEKYYLLTEKIWLISQTNGATQAVIDARVLGAALIEHGVTPRALQAYDAQLREDISAVVLRNRGAGPFGLLNLLDERCGGVFDDIDAVIPAAEREAFMDRYRTAAGFAMERLNAAPPIIPPGARVAQEASACCSTMSS